MGIETITPTWVNDGKYGLSVGVPSGEPGKLLFYNVSKKSGLSEKDFPKGVPVAVKVYVGKTGNKQIDEIVSSGGKPTASANPPSPVSPATSPAKVAYGRPLSPYEEEKDRRIHVSGILQALIHSQAVSSFSATKEEFSENVKALTKEFLAFAQELVEAPHVNK